VACHHEEERVEPLFGVELAVPNCRGGAVRVIVGSLASVPLAGLTRGCVASEVHVEA
jgi:hypothetical protein